MGEPVRKYDANVALPAVVIELPAVDRGSPLVDALVSACNESVAEARCVLASDVPEPEIAAAAVVTWEDERKVANVSVGLRRGTRGWLSRRIDFREADAPKERWRSVGLVIATLVGEADRAAKAEASSAAAAPPSPTGSSTGAATASKPSGAASSDESNRVVTRAETPSPRRPPPSTRGHEVVFVDGGALVDPGFGDAWFRWGGWLRVATRPSSSPWFAHVGGRYSIGSADGGVSLAWISASAGLGAILPLPNTAARLEGHVDGVLSLARASVTDPTTGARDSGQRTVGGGRAAIDAVWSPAPTWAFVAGVDGTMLSSGTLLRIRGEQRGRDSNLVFSALIGGRIMFR